MSEWSEDHPDFINADRGFLGSLSPGVITGDDGAIVFDADAAHFLRGDAPQTVHPGLWRQSKLTAKHGLYEIAEGFYQVRGYDISNMTLVEGRDGVIVIDPLTCQETAAAGLGLYREHRGNRSVSAVIYSHAHLDHFGGVLGVVEPTSTVPIIAPEHFLDHAISENVYAGVAMLRRTMYYDGSSLPLAPDGAVGIGLGPRASHGTPGLLAPTVEVTRTGQEISVDGVRIVFQLTPGTESPAEMNFYFPDSRILCMAENASHTLHNLLTLRGAQVRDPRIWARYLAESIELFAYDSDIVFSSHHWPTWGTENIIQYLVEQRDAYAYLHDQSVRLMNKGLIGSEIAELVDSLSPEFIPFSVRGYYGSVNHNVKAVYQRYLGWYDGNPAHLWQHPPEAQASRYAELMGGVDGLVRAAEQYCSHGDLRFAAELASHAVFADPSHSAARVTLAGILEQLGFGAENATWRNAYLNGANELRHGVVGTALSSAGLMGALTVPQLLDTLSIRVDAHAAQHESGSIRWELTDLDEVYRMELSHGALVHFPTRRHHPADLVVSLTKPELLTALQQGVLPEAGVRGDGDVWRRILAVLDAPDPLFAVVTP